MSEEAYIRSMLSSAEIAPERLDYILGEMRAGREWHPKTYGELSAALRIMVHALEGRPVALAVFPFVGEVLKLDEFEQQDKADDEEFECDAVEVDAETFVVSNSKSIENRYFKAKKRSFTLFNNPTWLMVTHSV